MSKDQKVRNRTKYQEPTKLCANEMYPRKLESWLETHIEFSPVFGTFWFFSGSV